jgi:hypothetical protein
VVPQTANDWRLRRPQVNPRRDEAAHADVSAKASV